MTPEQVAEITQLRSRNVSPKQIARKLGLRPAEVSAIIKQKSQDGTIQKKLPTFKACLINEKAADHLLNAPRTDIEGDGVGGMAHILLLRVDEREHYWVSSYLIDYWCLGVKNTFGPRHVSRRQYDTFVQETESQFQQGLREITLEQAQSIIFGVVDYAASLGLQPHKDFRRSRAHLGPRPEQLLDIEFGHNGQPYFIGGPYDDAVKTLRTLKENVGASNFRALAGMF